MLKIPKLLSINEVCSIMRFSKSKVYQMVREQTFPSGLSDGWRRLWYEPEIRAFRVLYWNTNEKIPEELQLCLERWKQRRKVMLDRK